MKENILNILNILLILDINYISNLLFEYLFIKYICFMKNKIIFKLQHFIYISR